MQQAPDFAELGALIGFATNAQHDEAFKSIRHLLAQQLHEFYLTVDKINERVAVLNSEANHVFAVCVATSACTIRFCQSDVLEYVLSMPINCGKTEEKTM